jgi:hypothetical protein
MAVPGDNDPQTMAAHESIGGEPRMSFGQKIEQLNEAISATFDQAFSTLRREVQDRLRDTHQELQRSIDALVPQAPHTFVVHDDLAPAADQAREEGRAAARTELRDGFAALDRARSQAEVLGALTAAATRFASRAAVLLWRNGELRGWGGDGFADAAPALRRLVLSPPAKGPWAAAPSGGSAAGGGLAVASSRRLSAADCAVLCEPIESALPAYGCLIPLVLRDHVVALLYADRLPAAGAGAAGDDAAEGSLLAPLQSLAYVAALAIETLPFRQRPATATLADPAAEPAAPPAAEGSAEASADTSDSAPSPAVAAPAAEPGRPDHAATAEPDHLHEEPSSVSPEAGFAGAPVVAAPAPEEVAAQPAPAAASPAPATGAGPQAPPSAQPAPLAPLAPNTAEPRHRQSGATPFAVTPADLYDSPSAAVVQETAEIPRPRPLRAVEPRGGSPYLEDGTEPAAPSEAPAAAPAAPGPAETAAGTGSSAPDATIAASSSGSSSPAADTLLLPHAALRDASAPAWGRRTAELGSAPAGVSGLAENQDEAPPAGERLATPVPFPTRDRGAAPLAGTFGTAGAAPISSDHSAAPAALPADTAAVGGGAAGLRAVPPAAETEPAATAASLPPIAPAFEVPRAGGIGSGTPEVRPPSGVQGPGWAFATSRMPVSSGDEALHDEARRLARLLVSEIKLYNEDQVEAGRRNRDIYERLREDIDRSRQMYEERVEPRLAKSTDYFYQELVRILAAGDAKALGI